MTNPTVETAMAILSKDSELPFFDISGLLGREPSEVRSLHHLTRFGRLSPMPTSEWRFSTGERELSSVADGMRELIDNFETDWAAFAEFCSLKRYEISVTSLLRIYDWDDRPFTELDKNAIGFLWSAKATWRLDILDFSQPDA